MIEVAYTQHSGKQHGTQQDALWFGTASLQSADASGASALSDLDSLLLSIADGVAVSPSPQIASRFVLESLAALLPNWDFNPRLIRKVHGALCDRYAKGRTRGAATTLVAAVCKPGSCIVMNVGDSRAWLIPVKGTWQQLSHDHILLNELIGSGQAAPDQNYAQIYDGLAACLIADDEEDTFPIHYREAPFASGDTLLLCSDGVHDVVNDQKLVRLYNPQRPCVAQVECWRKAVLAAGAPDNFSIILARKMGS